MSQGIQLHKGDLVRLTDGEDSGIYEVERPNEWWSDFNSWGSVYLVGLYPPRFTHKGGVELLHRQPSISTLTGKQPP